MPLMKSCPTCQRTFDETTVFCLVDGSILSAPFDPEAKRQFPDRRHESPRTKVMDLPPAANPLPQTIASPLPTIGAPVIPISPPPSSVPAPGRKKFGLIFVAAALTLLLVSGALIVYVLRPFQSCPNIKVHCYPDGGTAYCDVVVEELTATGNQSLDASPLICSLTPALALQAPAVPKTVTGISWTASAGKIKSRDSNYQQVASMDTIGFAGREITVTARVSGYGWRCANTASTSFIAK